MGNGGHRDATRHSPSRLHRLLCARRLGPGSDLDVLVVVEQSSESFERRAAAWDTTALPVPVDLMVYTKAEWERLDPQGRFGRMVAREAVWVYVRPTSVDLDDT